MTVTDIFLQLRQAGANLSLKGDALHLSALPNTLPASLLQAVRTQKVALVEHLSQPKEQGPGPLTPSWQDAAGIYYPVHPVLEREWLLFRLKENGNFFNIQLVVEVEDLKKPLLEAVIRHLVARHESLRTCLRVVAGTLRQLIVEPGQIGPLPIDYRLLPEGPTSFPTWVEWCRQANETAFDLERAPLFRVLCGQQTDGRSKLCLTIHHAIADNESTQLLKQEMAQVYASLLRQEPVGLPPVIEHYKDYIHRRLWRASQRKSYWLRLLRQGLPELTLGALPAARPADQYETIHASINRLGIGPARWVRELVRRVDTPDGGEFKTCFDQATLDRLHVYCRAWQVEFPALLGTLFSLALRQTVGQQRVVYDVPMIDRDPHRNAHTIGWLTCGIYCPVDIDETQPLGKEVVRVQAIMQEGIDNGGVDMTSLLDEVGLPEAQIPSMLLNCLRFSGASLPEARQQTTHKTGGLIAYFDLFLMIGQFDNALEWITIYRTDRASAAVIEQLHASLASLLAALPGPQEHTCTAADLMGRTATYTR
ncbi:condensation domain-containing protein [Fibrella sp. WM1]|uniref:condensation domain-containing protein n=1 Tax=Fibrella musci TaxID=3242485 RepID=UPI00352105DD